MTREEFANIPKWKRKGIEQKSKRLHLNSLEATRRFSEGASHPVQVRFEEAITILSHTFRQYRVSSGAREIGAAKEEGITVRGRSVTLRREGARCEGDRLR